MKLLYDHEQDYIVGRDSKDFVSERVATISVYSIDGKVQIQSRMFDPQFLEDLKGIAASSFVIVNPTVKRQELNIYSSEHAEEVGATKEGYILRWSGED